MTLARLWNTPTNDYDFAVWASHNWTSHNDINRYAFENGVKLTPFQLWPVFAGEQSDFWLHHQQAHFELAKIGIQSLWTAIPNWNDPISVKEFIEKHYQDHVAANDKLEIYG